MKSSFSNSQGNCVDVEYVILPDGEFVQVTDTKGKTGDVRLLFTRDEWDAFLRGVQNSEFRWETLKNASWLTASSRALPETAQRVAGQPISPSPQRRTPENIAYVNGRHDERRGRFTPTYPTFCRRLGHDPSDDRSRRIYDAYLTGRRAEAHDRALREE